jgi:hypothetical protein
LVVVLTGCGSAPSPSEVPESAASTAYASVASSAAPPPAASPSPSAASSASSSSPRPSGSGLPIDPTLLDLLPASLAGLDRQSDPEVDAHAFGDPALAAIGTAGASAIYADPSSGDFAYATLIRLVGGRISDAAFRAYRDSFDTGACSQAGGVGGNAQATLGGRTTYIGTCGGGLRTYHALLPHAGVLVSISSAGARGLGEQLAAAVAG